MTDKIALPLPDGRWLVLDRATFDAALAEGAALMSQQATSSLTNSPATEPLIDAAAAEKLTGVPRSWFAEAARKGSIPTVWLGRYPRFRMSALIEALECRENRRTPMQGVRLSPQHFDHKDISRTATKNVAPDVAPGRAST
jgi:hypothetical protein